MMPSASRGATPPLRSAKKRANSMRVLQPRKPVAAARIMGWRHLKLCERESAVFSRICPELSAIESRSFYYRRFSGTGFAHSIEEGGARSPRSGWGNFDSVVRGFGPEAILVGCKETGDWKKKRTGTET